MRVEEIMLLEKDGIINTINDYTREHFVRNYTSLLKNVTYPQDKDQLLMITYRLVEWYENNLNLIMDNQYINNKHEHEKSIELLREVIKQLKTD